MPVTTVIAATTSAVSNGSQAKFNAHGLTESIAAVAFGLAGGEKVYVWVGSGAGWGPLYENDLQITLTATSPQVSLLPGLHYGFTKDASGSPVSVEVMSTR